MQALFLALARSVGEVETWVGEKIGFVRGLGLQECSDWCLDVLYLQREFARDYSEMIEYEYCRGEVRGSEARPAFEQMKKVSRSPALEVSQSLQY